MIKQVYYNSDKIYIYDRGKHLMTFNNLYQFDLSKGIKNLSYASIDCFLFFSIFKN